MTVGSKLHKTLTELESAKADLESFAMDTRDQQAKSMFQNSARQVDQVVRDLRGRTNYVEQQEPAYKQEEKMT